MVTRGRRREDDVTGKGEKYMKHTHTHTHTTLVVMVIVFNWSTVLLRSLQRVQELLNLVGHSALTTMSGRHHHLRHLETQPRTHTVSKSQ